MGLKKNTVSKQGFIVVQNGLYNLVYTSRL